MTHLRAVTGFPLAALVALCCTARATTANPSRNLALEATISTPHLSERAARKAGNVADGKVSDRVDQMWAPAVDQVNAAKPIVLALTWEKPVAIDRIVLHWADGETETSPEYSIGTWREGAPLPSFEAPCAFDVTDVFVGGTGGYHTYRIPALVVSKRGTLLAFCEGRLNNVLDFGVIDLLVKRSLDEGRTWSAQTVVHSERGPSPVTIGNPVPIVDAGRGEIHLVFCRDAQRVLYKRSTDDGVTFTPPMDITATVDELCASVGFRWKRVFTGPGHGLQMSTGRLLVPIKPSGDAQDGISRRVGVIYSDDGGRAWKAGGIVPPTLGEMSESTLFESHDGTLVMNIRWHDGRYRAVSRSIDGGVSWSSPEPDTALPDPVCQGSILRFSEDPDDRRVVFSNLDGQELGSLNRRALTVRLSEDDGRTWVASRLVTPGPSAYSDLAVDVHGGLLLFFERGTEFYAEKLTLARFSAHAFETSETAPTESFDRSVAARVATSPNWKPLLRVSANRSDDVHEHVLPAPVSTQTLLLSISSTGDPNRRVLLSEFEVWGTGNPRRR